MYLSKYFEPEHSWTKPETAHQKHLVGMLSVYEKSVKILVCNSDMLSHSPLSWRRNLAAKELSNCSYWKSLKEDT